MRIWMTQTLWRGSTQELDNLPWVSTVCVETYLNDLDYGSSWATLQISIQALKHDVWSDRICHCYLPSTLSPATPVKSLKAATATVLWDKNVACLFGTLQPRAWLDLAERTALGCLCWMEMRVLARMPNTFKRPSISHYEEILF